MRVVSGKYGGIKLNSPETSAIRPTTDRIKETLFNILYSSGILDDSVVLDLFCGSGALGIEALSRGASRVYFVDSKKYSMDLCKLNLNKISGDIHTLMCDFSIALNKFSTENIKFDLILLDPPYNMSLEQKAIQLILNLNLLDENGIIAVETDKNLDLSKFLDTLDVQYKSRNCGNTTLHFISKV